MNTSTVGTIKVLHKGCWKMTTPAMIPTMPESSFQPHIDRSMKMLMMLKRPRANQ